MNLATLVWPSLIWPGGQRQQQVRRAPRHARQEWYLPASVGEEVSGSPLAGGGVVWAGGGVGGGRGPRGGDGVVTVSLARLAGDVPGRGRIEGKNCIVVVIIGVIVIEGTRAYRHERWLVVLPVLFLLFGFVFIV